MPDATDRPNLLLVTSDQHRADFLGCAGHPYVRTPHLDRLALGGTRFTRAHVECPVCIPARTSLVTGRHAWRNGMPEYSGTFRVRREPHQWLGALLTAAGYQTELVGKTHWHTEAAFRAGFEHVTWLAGLRREQLLHRGRGGKTEGLGFNEVAPSLSDLPAGLQQAQWITDRGIDFLQTRDRGQPFALWLSHQDPHPPLTIHEPYYSLYRGCDDFAYDPPAWIGGDREPRNVHEQRHSWNPPGLVGAAEMRHAREVYAGMTTNLDHQLGRVIAALMSGGDWENTLVIYSSDHGEFLGDFGMIGKRQFLRASANVPMIVRPPATWGAPVGRTSDALVGWADLLPTLCAAAGADVPEDVDGRSFLGVARGEADAHHAVLHGQLGVAHMLHAGDRKYLYFTDDGAELAFADGDERTPLGEQETAELRARFVRHLKDVGHPDVSADGTLRNDRLPKIDEAELHARFGVSGIGAIGHMDDHLLRDVQPIG